MYKPLLPSLAAGCRILTAFPSTTTFVLALGIDLPCADNPGAGTLGLSAEVYLTLLYATHISFISSDISRVSREYSFYDLRNAPLPLVNLCDKPVSSVHSFSPVTFSIQKSLFRQVSCYAFFKRWLLLSQLPSCFGLSTFFTT